MTNPTNNDIMRAIADLRNHFDGKLDAIGSDIRVINARLDGIDKRLDDQNQIIAALIPVKVAAVGGR